MTKEVKEEKKAIPKKKAPAKRKTKAKAKVKKHLVYCGITCKG